MSARGWVAAVAALVGTAVLAVPGSASAAGPWVRVTPNSGLKNWAAVTVSAHALPPNISVDLVECDVPTTFTDDAIIGCGELSTVVTDAQGDLQVDLRVMAVVYRQQHLGDSRPVYCRADQCRIYAEWTDSSRVIHSVPTNRMHFAGSPATLTVSPSTGLADGARVRVTGSAQGTTGHYVTIVEEECFSIIQGHSCDGRLSLVSLPVDARGRFSGLVTVYRTLADGGDCLFGSGFGPCELSVIVLDSSGQPDETFGVIDWGDPGADISFAGP